MARGYECGCWQSDDGSFRLCLMHEEQNKMPPDPDTQDRQKYSDAVKLGKLIPLKSMPHGLLECDFDIPIEELGCCPACGLQIHVETLATLTRKADRWDMAVERMRVEIRDADATIAERPDDCESAKGVKRICEHLLSLGAKGGAG